MSTEVIEVEDVQGEARAFRAKIVEWAQRYAQSRAQVGESGVTETDAQSDLRHWSGRYFNRTAGTCPSGRPRAAPRGGRKSNASPGIDADVDAEADADADAGCSVS